MSRIPMRRLLFLLSSFHFFNELILIYPIYTLMFADAGLSGSQISIVVGIFSVTTVVAEIPSGIIADARGYAVAFAVLGGVVLLMGVAYAVYAMTYARRAATAVL